MNNMTNTIASIKNIISISDVQANELELLFTNSLSASFEFCNEHYSLNDVQPSSLANALTPYLVADFPVTSKNMELQARYIEQKSAFEFEVDVSFDGMKQLLIENTSISAITVNPVYASDELEINNATQTVHHKRSGDKSLLDGIYSIIMLEDGQTFLNQMNADEANQAMYSNCHQRLNGVNPYRTQSQILNCKLSSCLRRSLKNIAVMKTVNNTDFISTLLNLHDQQYSKAQAIRSVSSTKNRFRTCANQRSKIDTIFKQSQGSVVIPFGPTPDKASKANQQIMLASEIEAASIHKLAVWDGDDFGLGF